MIYSVHIKFYQMKQKGKIMIRLDHRKKVNLVGLIRKICLEILGFLDLVIRLIWVGFSPFLEICLDSLRINTRKQALIPFKLKILLLKWTLISDRPSLEPKKY